jgi:TIR domain-containing protein
MPSLQRREELVRLQKAFEAEADQFHDLSLSIFYFTQAVVPSDRKFRSPNHTIMLWQYYGLLSDNQSELERLARNLNSSNVELAGVRGSEFSCFAAIEGPRVEHFVRMAKRAGSIFSEAEVHRIRVRLEKDFLSNENQPKGKRVFVGNSNPLASWLNYVLNHLQKTHPRYLPEVKLHLDPFAASLSAIDKLLKPRLTISKSKKSGIELRRFRVALSFAGEHRPYVESVASNLRAKLGDESVFYDKYFEADLARPNLDIVLQNIYHRGSELIVVFLCENYSNKEWCGLEWRALRDIIKQTRDDRIMLLRFDDAAVPGLFGIDGYVDIGERSPSEAAELITTRLNSVAKRRR